jgi:hypothetical protein
LPVFKTHLCQNLCWLLPHVFWFQLCWLGF